MTLTGNFDKLNKPKTDETKEAERLAGEKEIELYPTGGQTRNLCFVQLDGKRMFLNYAYLISGEYVPEENTITLAYTTHTVMLKGHRLESLYESLMEHQVQRISCTDKRYLATKEDGESVVTEIEISPVE